MNAAVEPARLYTVLDRANIRQKQPVMYQLLYNLIGNLTNIMAGNTDVLVKSSTSTGTGGSTSTIISQTNQFLSFGDQFQEDYYMISGGSGSGVPSVYDSPLTNGNPAAPELIFDSFGDVIVVQVPL